MEKRIAPTKFCVETLIPQGLCILAGAPKIGKSWLVLDLCVKVAKGESFLGQPTIIGNGIVPVPRRQPQTYSGASMQYCR